MPCRGDFWYFVFFLPFSGLFLSKFGGRGPKFGLKGPENDKKSKYQKSPVWGTRYHWSGYLSQILSKLSYPVARRLCSRRKMGTDFLRFSYTFCQKCARSSLLRRVISWEPLRVEEKVSPFWKLDIQGCNIYLNGKKTIFWPWTPPPAPVAAMYHLRY